MVKVNCGKVNCALANPIVNILASTPPYNYNQARFGFTANQENNCNSNDTAIGLGLGPKGHDDNNDKKGAGYICKSTQCSKGNVNEKGNGYLWIR